MKQFSELKKPLLILGILFLSINAAQSQNSELRDAKNSLKDLNYYNAALISAKVLCYSDLSKGQLKNGQEILFETKDKSFEMIEASIKADEEKCKNYEPGETLFWRSRIISSYQKLVTLLEVIEKIPAKNLSSVNKKTPNLEFTSRSYSVELEDAKSNLQNSKVSAADNHYQKGIELSTSADINDLIAAHKEFGSIGQFISPYKDEKDKLDEVGKKIAEMRLKEGLLLRRSPDDLIKAHGMFKNGLTYYQLEELIKAEEETRKMIAQMRLKEGLSLGENPEDLKRALRLFKDGLKYYELDELLKATEKAGKGLLSVYYTKAEKILEENNQTVFDYAFHGTVVSFGNQSDDKLYKKVTVASIDDSHLALEYLDEFEKSAKDYQNIVGDIEFEKMMKNFPEIKKISQKALYGIHIQDVRNKKGYMTTKVNDLVWMIPNLDYSIDESIYYYETSENGKKERKDLGRFYSTSSNVNPCPEGWRLPSIMELKSLPSKGYFYTFNGIGVKKPELSYSTKPFDLLHEKISGGFLSNQSGSYLSFNKTSSGNSDNNINKATNAYVNCRCVKEYSPTVN